MAYLSVKFAVGGPDCSPKTPTTQQLSATVVTVTEGLPLVSALPATASGCPDCATPVYETAPALHVSVPIPPVKDTDTVCAPVAGFNRYHKLVCPTEWSLLIPMSVIATPL